MNDREGVKCIQKLLDSDGNAVVYFNQLFSNGTEYSIYGEVYIIF